MRINFKRLWAFAGLLMLLLVWPAPAWAGELYGGSGGPADWSAVDLDTVGLEQAIDEVAQYLGQAADSQALREL